MSKTLISSWGRFAALAILLGGTAFVLRARGDAELLPQHKNMSAFPAKFSAWYDEDIPLSPGILRSLGPGEFLFRDYYHPQEPTNVNLFVAFFPSQRTSDSIHSPKNCLPGNGWVPIESGRLWIEKTNSGKIEVNRYIVELGQERAVVLYWFQAHGRVTPSEYWAKFYLVTDSLRMARSDGSMVRIFAPVEGKESMETTQRRAVGFARQLLPVLDDYIPR